MPLDIVESLSPADGVEAGFTADELEQFHRDGYVIARGLSEPALCARMLAAAREHLERQVEPIEYEADLHYPGAPASRNSNGGQTVRRLKQAHSRGFVFTEWVNHPRLQGRLRQLLGAAITMPLAHHNCIMTKQPRHSSETGWHRDIRYWAFDRPELVSVWLALGPESPANGCLRLIPGSHQLEFAPGQLDAEAFFRTDVPENQALIDTQVEAELQPGDVLFFHCRTLHSAGRNTTGEPKISVVFTFRPTDNPPIRGTRSAALPELQFA